MGCGWDDLVIYETTLEPTVSSPRLQLVHGFEIGAAPRGAVQGGDGAPVGVIRVNLLHLVRLVGVVVGVHSHGEMLLFGQRRGVSNESEHHLAVDETQRVHDANRGARRSGAPAIHTHTRQHVFAQIKAYPRVIRGCLLVENGLNQTRVKAARLIVVV